jgi:hypothetical protein
MEDKLTMRERDFNHVYEVAEARLDQLGHITTGEICNKCRISYSRAAKQFVKIMKIMVLQGKATKYKQGQWIIVKANRRMSEVQSLKAA